MHVEAAILAGGLSSRMGRDKARVEVDGAAMIERVAAALRPCVDRVRVVLHGDTPASPIDLPVIRDSFPERAPIVGVAAALAHAEASWVLVAACDLPHADPALVLALTALAPLVSEHDVIAPESERGPEPLLALYRPELLSEIERCIARGDLSLMPLLRRERTLCVPVADLRSIDPELASLHNVNRPEDLTSQRGASR